MGVVFLESNGRGGVFLDSNGGGSYFRIFSISNLTVVKAGGGFGSKDPDPYQNVTDPEFWF